MPNPRTEVMGQGWQSFFWPPLVPVGATALSVACDVSHAPGSDIWSFQFVPTQNGENPYVIAVTVTDGAGNSTIDTLQVVAVKTGKPVP
jgi:hypothetical protein